MASSSGSVRPPAPYTHPPTPAQLTSHFPGAVECATGWAVSVPGLRSAVVGVASGPGRTPVEATGLCWQGPVSIRVDTAADLGVSVHLRQAEGFQS